MRVAAALAEGAEALEQQRHLVVELGLVLVDGFAVLPSPPRTHAHRHPPARGVTRPEPRHAQPAPARYTRVQRVGLPS
jgi:hypothetical protein